MFKVISSLLLFTVAYGLMLYGAFSIHYGFGFFTIGAVLFYETRSLREKK